MFLLLLVLSVLLGSIQALKYEEANEYMDRVLNSRFVEEAKYSRLDPYKLDNISVALNSTGIQKGRALLSKGKLLHLSRVRRAADCTVPFFQSANITFTCFLRFDQLRVNYTAEADYENMNVVFYPHVAIKDTNVTVQVTTNREDDIPSLKLIFINHMGRMNVTANMISIGDLAQRVGPPVREALIKKSVQTMHQAIGGRFKDALSYSIYKTPVGFEK